MRLFKTFLIVLFILPLMSLKEFNKPLKKSYFNFIYPNGTTVETRFKVPQGFVRKDAASNSFGSFLRKLPLKAHGSKVKLYNGAIKENHNVYEAVVDLDIGKKDLQQCADAVMRLRAEYLFKERKFDKIHFNFTNGFRVNYTEWVKGKRMVVKGNKTYWVQRESSSNTYDDLRKYLELVFTYAGTMSLKEELKPVKIEDIQIGDVFIQGGQPGHAVIVVDVAENNSTGKKVFLLAQSYMPAQDIQILKNTKDSNLSPWYSFEIGEQLKTPEWIFSRNSLRRFEEN